MQHIYAYIQLMRWHSPIGALLLLAPVSWALVIAFDGTPPLAITLVFVCGVWFARSLGCVINDMLDKDIDAQVARTKSRPLANKMLTIKQAAIVALLLTAVCVFLLVQLPPHLLAKGAIAGLLLCVYPLMKRVFVLPQLLLALAFSWSIIIVFSAADSTLAWHQLPTQTSCWLLFFANCAWVVAYDTQYAMMDIKDDSKIGVQSSARLFAGAQHGITAALLTTFVLLLFILRDMVVWNKNIFLLVLVAIALWLFYLLRFTRNAHAPSIYARAFKHHAAIGLALTFGMVLSYHL